jgi:DNA sulfur modification protein DndC
MKPESRYPLEARQELDRLVKEGAVFYVSHSGGKDSQAMYALIAKVVPREQIVVVHADLGEIEWDGVQDHIRANVDHPVNVVSAGKTFFEMVRRRAEKRPDVPAWPSSATRQCTSDLKRGPIYKFIRHDMKARGETLGVNCMGLRAAESPGRAKRKPLSVNQMLSKAGRTVYEYLPIHGLLEEEVFQAIANAGQKPFWAYGAGNRRLSCVFCIMGCASDLRNGRKYRPDLYKKYLSLEAETGWTMFNGASLAEKAGDEPKADKAAPGIGTQVAFNF